MCDTRCDCDEVERNCPAPLSCRKANPNNCSTYWQCDASGKLFEKSCPNSLYWNDNLLTCEKLDDSTCPFKLVGLEVREDIGIQARDSFVLELLVPIIKILYCQF
ncbi:hypothetical protein PPL_04876 [Heterostelium album PN500]|uniref:Chitin-binding type-2 domain-containing protein n=1 Tax=Heterostelium pallidum (strain ATCC 26659 / Pp 5 / PN500) TaxID=670386 RepID=D3B8T3_HETP5|nr:hypothetical protein PPL_04876 [Heterostelium album PN500]EFA82451.1 hypothetical protein PPL_04876 [Heterostelium album PN500]|eukprot:XP_020434568.1 hypothetical protein PPL_04876 [Heterostelium album PN500]